MDPSSFSSTEIVGKLIKKTFVEENQLEKRVNKKWLPYIRPSQRQAIIAEGHQVSRHGHLEKTYKKLKNKLYWEGMKSNIQLYLDNCIECPQFKGLPKRFLFIPNKILSPFYCVSIDIIGPLPKTKH